MSCLEGCWKAWSWYSDFGLACEDPILVVGFPDRLYPRNLDQKQEEPKEQLVVRVQLMNDIFPKTQSKPEGLGVIVFGL